MEIKKKIAVWCALFALLVALVPPSSAKANTTETTADDVKYADVEDFMHSMGYTTFVKEDGVKYIVYCSDLLYQGANLNVIAIKVSDDSNPYFAKKSSAWLSFFNDTGVPDGSVTIYSYYPPQMAALQNNIEVVSSSNEGGGSSESYNGVPRYYVCTSAKSVIPHMLYSDLDIYDASSYKDTGKYVRDCSIVLFESTKYDSFSFPVWCGYAGLNCLASSNESPTNIPYSYNSYWHIVRKTSSGNWLLTTIGSTLGQSKMNLRLSDSGDLIIYEFSGDDSFVISVRQYIYEADGWKVRKYDTYDYDDFASGIVELPAGTGINNTVGLAYTSTDIYSSDGLTVYVSASEEYAGPLYPDVAPPSIDEPTITPTPAPSGGYDVITYNPTLEGSVVADSVYMRELPSSDSVAVGAFIKTWHVNVHGYCRDNDGVIWYLCSTVRDDIDYSGYIMAKYVKLESYGDIVIDFGDIDIADIPTIVDSAKESVLSILGLVGVVPMMIGAVFGFLPSWCLLMVGATVVVMCIVGIIKVFRG